MANPCAPNASRPKAGVQTVVALGAVAISDLLLAGRASWAFDLAVALGIISYDTGPFCAADPPDLPNIPPERYLGYFNPLNPQGAAQLRADMSDLVGHFFWYASCECAAGPQPPAPLPMPPPTGVQRDPPGLGTPVGGTACGQSDIEGNQLFDSSSNILWTWRLPPNAVVGAQWLQFTANGGPQGAQAIYPVTNTLEFVNASGVQVGSSFVWTDTAPVPAATPKSFSLEIPPGTATFRLRSHGTNASGVAMILELFLSQYCTAAPPSLNEPCCPPDPLLVQLLNQILRELDELLARGTGATGYSRGTRHAGLSGTGSLATSRAAGILIEVQSGAPTIPVLGGNPPYQWDLGFITMLTGDGMILERRLTRTAQLWLDPSWALATSVGYFLNPGVTVAITELVSAALP